MLNKLENGVQREPVRNRRRERKLWHNERSHVGSLGCTLCPHMEICGGLSAKRPVYDCLDLCCGSPSNCDSVCRNKPRDFARRIREVDGFQLDNVPRTAAQPDIVLPRIVPVVYHGDRPERPFDPPAICLPLYAVVRRSSSRERFANADAIAGRFKFKAGTPLVLTGTDNDRPLERWWSLGGHDRKQAIRTLQGLGVQLVTTPNFSMFTDRTAVGRHAQHETDCHHARGVPERGDTRSPSCQCKNRTGLGAVDRIRVLAQRSEGDRVRVSQLALVGRNASTGTAANWLA